MPAKSFYSTNIEKYSSLLKRNKKHRFWIGLLRLVTFIAASFSLYYYIQNPQTFWLLMLVGALILFIWLIKRAADLAALNKLLEKLHFLNSNELNIGNHLPNKFDNGTKYLDFNSYLLDLDIFGEGSVFHLLNRTTTTHGTRHLVDLLSQSLQEKQVIENYQHAIKALSSQPGICQLITAHGLLNIGSEENLQDIIHWLESPEKVIRRKWLQPIRFLMPVINILTFIFYLNSDNYIPFIIAIVVSWTIIGSFAKYISIQHVLLSRKQAILEQYASILKTFSTVDENESALLKKLRETAESANHEIFGLSRLSALFDQRLNLVVNIFLNSFLLYDIHCIFSLENWKIRNRNGFQSWINCVGNIESLVSFSTFAFNHPSYSYPKVMDGNAAIRAKGLGHPLLQEEELVTNDIIPGENEKILLITGSNMSGKTTFLRSVGVNLLLAQCGAPVCADSFSFTPMQILTSIRINDSLQDHTSYFMAELKRLRSIIYQLDTDRPSLLLIDEILRGTNSDDKTHGSSGFIKKLVPYNCLSFFATHDLALSLLAEEYPGIISNYCFESTIVEGELLFDYTLREGVAKNKNASFLMEKMGII